MDGSGFGMNLSADCLVTSFSSEASVAKVAGVTVGCRVVQVNGQPVAALADIVSLLKQIAPGSAAEFMTKLPVAPVESAEEAQVKVDEALELDARSEASRQMVQGFLEKRGQGDLTGRVVEAFRNEKFPASSWMKELAEMERNQELDVFMDAIASTPLGPPVDSMPMPSPIAARSEEEVKTPVPGANAVAIFVRQSRAVHPACCLFCRASVCEPSYVSEICIA